MSNSIDALKTIVTFDSSKDFMDQEALEQLATSFHEFVMSEDSDLKTLLPQIITKISEVLKNYEGSFENNEQETNDNSNETNQNDKNESFTYKDLDRWVIDVANRFVI